MNFEPLISIINMYRIVHTKYSSVEYLGDIVYNNVDK